MTETDREPTIIERVVYLVCWITMFGIPVCITAFLLASPYNDVKVEPMWAILLAIFVVVIFHGALRAWADSTKLAAHRKQKRGGG